MKKLFYFGIMTSLFAFNVNQTYSCKTLGLSYKENNQTYNIPNSQKTSDMLKKSLKKLYTIKIKPQKENLIVYVGDKNDTLSYVKTLKKVVKLYKTKGSDSFILVDEKASQVGLSIPSQKMIIYYQCK